MKICIACNAMLEEATWKCAQCNYMPEIISDFISFAPSLAYQNDNFEVSYFSKLAEVEKKNFWFRIRNNIILWSLSKYFSDAKNLLEIGCGTGFVSSGILSQFPHIQLSGSDLYCAGLSFAAERLKNVGLYQMDARQMPFKEEFDVIGAFDVLEHIQEDELVLTEMYKALRPGGGIILTVPQHQFLWSQQDDHSCHVRRYSKKELANKVSAAGFKISRMTSFISLLLPAMVASRLMKRRSSKKYDLLSELKLPSAINSFFELVLTLEQQLIRLGINFPLGGSLLLIAEKN